MAVVAALRQSLMLMQTVQYFVRKPVFAAVINNLVASPAMHLFKSSQLAAWLSPLHSRFFAGIVYFIAFM